MVPGAFSSHPITRAGAVRVMGAATAAAILAPGIVGAADIDVVPIIGYPTDRSAVVHVHASRESVVRVDLPGAAPGSSRKGATAVARPGHSATIMIDGLEVGPRTPCQFWVRDDATGSDFIPRPRGAVQTTRRFGGSIMMDAGRRPPGATRQAVRPGPVSPHALDGRCGLSRVRPRDAR
jgi:hypothetical protein